MGKVGCRRSPSSPESRQVAEDSTTAIVEMLSLVSGLSAVRAALSL
ncbi:MAG: hypothetical protein ACFB0E_12715 [Leptolyngbyaceae cyanobacterium]